MCTSDLEQGICTALFKQKGKRRDILEQDEVEGNIKLVKKPKIAGFCTTICQY